MLSEPQKLGLAPHGGLGSRSLGMIDPAAAQGSKDAPRDLSLPEGRTGRGGSGASHESGRVQAVERYLVRNGLSFLDITGQKEAKQALFDRIILPIRHQSLAEIYGGSAQRALLLGGSCEAEKARLLMAAANEMGADLYRVPAWGPSGGGGTGDEADIGPVLAGVRSRAHDTGRAAILWIEQLDRLFDGQGSDGWSPAMARQVYSFVRDISIDGAGGPAVVIVGTAPSADALPPWLLRKLGGEVVVAGPAELS